MAEICDKAIKHLNKRIKEVVKTKTEEFHLYHYDSPIEQILCAELVANQMNGYGPDRIRTQLQEGPYRIDIAVEFFFGKNTYKVAIECDGHNYHERTEEQARRDKKKDRFLQANGWLIARFTGKQIFNDPEGCFNEVYEMICGIDLQKYLRENP